jgi:hypothetical protein
MSRNRFHLHSNPLDRRLGERDPRKIFWVSAEGAVTEKDYLLGISDYRRELGIVSIVNVEALSRKRSESGSKPKDVIALLDEFFFVRDHDFKTIIQKHNPSIFEIIPHSTISAYQEGALSETEIKKLEERFQLLEINLTYLNYLKKRSSDEDEFCIILDRDKHSNSEKSIQECIEWCNEKLVHLFFSNPCFEFWLLLHFKDIAKEFSQEDLNQFLENRTESNKHSFTSKTLSKVFKELTGSGHSKRISTIKFKEQYCGRVDTAIQHAASFAQSFPDLMHNLGTSMPKLIELLRQEKEWPLPLDTTEHQA